MNREESTLMVRYLRSAVANHLLGATSCDLHDPVVSIVGQSECPLRCDGCGLLPLLLATDSQRGKCVWKNFTG